jgi:hypothetical protein
MGFHGLQQGHLYRLLLLLLHLMLQNPEPEVMKRLAKEIK